MINRKYNPEQQEAKLAHARKLVEEGHGNEHILAVCKARFDSGVALATLAKWRREFFKPGDLPGTKIPVAPQPQPQPPKPDVQPVSILDRKREIICEVLLAGGSGHAAKKRIRAEFGVGCSYDLIKEVREDLGFTPPEPAIRPKQKPVSVIQPERAPVMVAQPKPAPVPVVQEAVNNHVEAAIPFERFADLLRWMQVIGAKTFTLTSDGRVDVLFHGQFGMASFVA